MMVGMKQMSSLFDELDTDGNFWKRAETKQQRLSSGVSRVQRD